MKYGIEVRNPAGNMVGRFKDLLSGEWEQSLNAPDQLTFTVPVEDVHSDNITGSNEYWLRDGDFTETKNVFRLIGRSDIRGRGNVVEARCLGLISQLDGELVVDYDTGDAGKTITQIVTDLLAMQVSANPITIGTIEPTVTRAMKIEGDTILKALWRLRETVGGYISINNARQLNWLNDVGEDKGQQIRYRKNLKGITREADYTEVIHKLYPYGAGETDARIKLSNILVENETATKSSDATYGYLTLGGQYSCYKDWTGAGDALPAEMVVKKNGVDNSSVWRQGANERVLRCAIADFDPAATYTITYRHADYLWDGTANPVIRQKVDKSFTHPDTLLAWARLYLDQYRLPRYNYQVDMVDLSERDPGFSFDALLLGSTVKVIDEELGIDISARIVKIRRPDLLNPEKIEIEIANRVRDITDVLGEVYDTQQLNQSMATKIGAGQVVVLGEFTVADWRAGSTTNIKGDVIRTGVIQSNNWQAGGQGSWIDLTNGLVKMGHYDDPEFYWDGSQLHVKGDITVTGYIQVGGAADDVNTHATTINGGKITTGTITADQLTTTSAVITVGAQIANAVISNAHITDLNASKINAGDIATERMQVNAANAVNAGGVVITADKISIVGKSLTDLTDRNLDNIANGASYGRVLLTDISAGHIKLSSVVQDSSYRTVSDAEKDTWNGKPDDMDEIANGVTYAKVLATDIQSGHIKLTSYTVASGKWYDTAGVSIDATNGIIIYGSATAFRTRATYGGADQCYMGSDGYIYAGAGNVKMGSDGLTITGQLLKFYYSGSQSGVIGSASASDWTLSGGSGRQVWLQSVYGQPIYISSGSGLYFQANNDIVAGYNLRPSSGGVYSIGGASYYWVTGYITTGYITNIYSTYSYINYYRSVSGGNIWFDQAEYMDIPRRSSAPTAYGGRMYMNTTDNVCYIYDASRSQWRDMGY